MAGKSYDTKCHELAESFSRDWPRVSDKGVLDIDEAIKQLAQRIQDCIEEFEEEKGLQT